MLLCRVIPIRKFTGRKNNEGPSGQNFPSDAFLSNNIKRRVRRVPIP